ncbi:LLM class flavin-dependent oxidoreductase [Actinomadura rubrisoli]|uniref:LLM class flavin-dependent oxidoreductase n=1 Tax=Actinomadura rubrisoli TaxID=2530368 RepID=A0A4R5BMJ2_9ACTN|nr:LLM class flavin-dependent oxidoreductase [Actinomadura rubrisoli]TDD88011.1 LLM class flavin-dependent oxidoreductase [Actinomadura rubrisoli]
MDIGVALPTMIPDVRGHELLDWARKADAGGFSALGVLDRLVYGNDEPLVTLAAAAAVTERVRLTTSILIAPCRGNTALLAKQAASVHHLSGGRLVLGVAVGARPDDYAASGAAFGDRGRRLDGMLADLRGTWAGGEIGPPLPGGGPEILVGGRAPAALRRAAAHGDGYMGAAGPPRMFAERAEEVRRLWAEAGRPGRPRMVAQSYFCLGAGAEENVRAHLGDYYSFAGRLAEMMISGALTAPETLRDAVAGYAAAGCDELILIPCSADPGQLELLAAALGEAA